MDFHTSDFFITRTYYNFSDRKNAITWQAIL